ncbi:MAG: response regulator [Myxococcota bacterium]
MADEIDPSSLHQPSWVPSPATARELFEGAPDALLVVQGSSGTVQHANHAAADLFGVASPSDLIGRTRQDLHGPILPAHEKPAPAPLVNPNGADHHVARCFRPDGSFVWADFMLSSTKGKSEFHVRLVDATARLEREQALTHARDVAQAAARARGAFLAMMSHELRTPLHTIVGSAELLRHQPKPGHRHVQHIATAAAELGYRLDDILLYASLVSGDIVLADSKIRPSEVVKHAVSRTGRPDCEARCITRLDVQMDQPVQADGRVLASMLSSLIDNALRHSDGTVTITASVHGDGEDARLEVCVDDQGDGDAAALNEGAEDALGVSDDVATRSSSGIGLGLPLARAAIKKLGGGLSFSSVSSDKGVRARLRMPIVLVAPHVATPRVAADDAAPRVLVVEDHPTNRMVAKAMLSRLGVSVSTAEDGFAALKMLATETFDLVLMDLHMPGMSGWETVEAATQRGLQIPTVVALTASTAPEDHAACVRVGMVETLAKPATLDQLRGALHRWTDLGAESQAA